MVLKQNIFGQVFTEILKKYGISCYEISQFSGLDEAYLSRLKNGIKNNPSLETVIKISLSLVHYSDRVQLYDIQRLLTSVGRSIVISAI